MTTRGLSDAELELVSRHGSEWRAAGWSPRQIAMAQILAANDLSAERAPDHELAPLVRAMGAQLAQVRADRARRAAEESVDVDGDEDLELAP